MRQNTNDDDAVHVAAGVHQVTASRQFHNKNVSEYISLNHNANQPMAIGQPTKLLIIA